jgi:hypothetical protein
MTDTDEIDTRRQKDLINFLDEELRNGPYSFRGIVEAGFSTDVRLDLSGVENIVRAIRLSDEAAGYITAKVKTLADVEREAGR